MKFSRTIVGRVLICICSVFIILFTSFTACSYLNINIFPEKGTNLNKQIYRSNNDTNIEPFKISGKDVVRYDNKCFSETNNSYPKYTIKKGDTLYNIAKSNISWCSPSNAVKKIIKINTIKDANSIKAGQQILLPVN